MSQPLRADAQFATESVPRLIVKFALPAIVSMTVNSLYNIVDQIFIGQGVGFIGNAATNAAMPFVTLMLALSLLIGEGAAAYFSLSLGRGHREAAARGTGTALMLALVAGFGLAIFGWLFTEPLLLFFGATPGALPYALEYVRITLLGTPLVVVSMVINGQTRADGSPRYAMVCMLAGCLLNTVLDPLFIFVFHWGVAGAAWATVIGQALNFSLTLLYLRRFRCIDFSRRLLRIHWPTAAALLKLGISSCVNQLAVTLVIIVMNTTIVRYGAASVYGADIPLAAVGIVMKVNMVVMAVLIGVSAGMQPIVGYNYGAGIYARVRQAYRTSILIATVWSCLGLLLFELAPQAIINLFGQEDALYQDFALKCFRIFLLALPTYGFQFVSTSLFQAIGQPGRATLCSLSRQAIFFLPLTLVLPRYFGLMGVLYAGPIADFCSFALILLLTLRELRQLDKMITVPAPV